MGKVSASPCPGPGPWLSLYERVPAPGPPPPRAAPRRPRAAVRDARLCVVPGSQHAGCSPRCRLPLPWIVPTGSSEVGAQGWGGGRRARIRGTGTGACETPLSARARTPRLPLAPPRAGCCQRVSPARGRPAARQPAGRAHAVVSPQRPCARRRGSRAAGGGRAAGWLGAGTPAAPPRAPSRPAGPPPPRQALLRHSSRLCNVSSRSGRGPAVAASAARPGGRSRREPAAPSPPPGRCGRLCAPRRGAWTPGQPGCGRAQRTVDTGLRGAAPRDRPGDGQPRRVPSTPPLPGGRSRSPSGPRHMTAATPRPASALAAGSAAPRPPAPARTEPR